MDDRAVLEPTSRSTTWTAQVSSGIGVATFLVADLVAGQPVLPSEGRSNAWTGCVGLLMTAVFVSGIVLRPQRRHLGLGLDSEVALLIYALGEWGLLVVSG
jgi:cation:H+ antiporter